MFEQEKEYSVSCLLGCLLFGLLASMLASMATKAELQEQLAKMLKSKNIRLPLSIIDGMKEAANRNGITEQEAYARALRVWLNNPEMQDSYED